MVGRCWVFNWFGFNNRIRSFGQTKSASPGCVGADCPFENAQAVSVVSVVDDCIVDYNKRMLPSKPATPQQGWLLPAQQAPDACSDTMSQAPDYDNERRTVASCR
jgi:hypothetical protein